MTKRTATFFYGSFINPDVLAQAGVFPENLERARLDGFDIDIAPRATITPSNQHYVYGILCQTTYSELETLYTKDHFGFGQYLPEAVLVSAQGRYVPALTYVAPTTPGGPPSQEYLDKIIKTAQAYEFPRWYIDRVASFAKKQSVSVRYT